FAPVSSVHETAGRRFGSDSALSKRLYHKPALFFKLCEKKSAGKKTLSGGYLSIRMRSDGLRSRFRRIPFRL
ncbi:MAG: hypothetical protein DBY36_02780, partial [Clostridiales bacterium]